MLKQLIRRFLGKTPPMDEPDFRTIASAPDNTLQWYLNNVVNQTAPAFAEHQPDETQKRFLAYDDDRRRVGYGSIWPNGDVAIHWASGPCTLIPAGGEWERFFVEWWGEY